ncbi:LytR C-terminal domain-containing protein [Nocardioides terrisoli]|uniref:LytR C-terminal domain-containing protein n=1 Tax=Nocardioides terrisoli TaxID=3388267 RepID=UPI00287BA31F|nr:LytR C-terminal domain-containing protein [Nocardioides marmorisolisilvae]
MIRPGGRRARRPGQDGIVLPTTALVASICAVAIAAVGFVLTSHPQQPAVDTASAHPPARTASPAPTLSPKPHKRHHHQAPPIDKKSIYVDVFNNSNIHGLAGRTAAVAQNAGWNVVGSDNWYGTIDTSTVYFPRTMRPAAVALAKDLHIATIKPAISPMKLDRLTVILTASYSG